MVIAGETHDELVPTETRENAAGRGLSRPASTEPNQEAIARRVTVAVVDALEVIDIENNDSDVFSSAPSAVDQMGGGVEHACRLRSRIRR